MKSACAINKPHYKILSGQILVLALVITAIGSILSIAVLQLATFDLSRANKFKFQNQATYISEAGIERALTQLNADTNYTGETNTSFGNGTFTIAVTGSGSERTIESTGYVPSSASPKARYKTRVKVELASTNVQFFYGVQVDSGGMTMNNNARVNGNLFSNGSVIGANGAVITGDTVVAGGITDSPTLEWASNDADQLFATQENNRDIAQSFIANAGDRLNRVSVFLGKVGNPTTNLTLRITADASNRPATTDLASAIITPGYVGTSPDWVNVAFASPPTLTTGTKYWIVLDSSSFSTTNNWNWRKDSTDSYLDNTGKTTSDWSQGGASWTDVGGDLAFRVWIGGVQTRIERVTIGDASSGTGRANLFVNTVIHGSACPNQYCLVENPARQELPIGAGVIQDWKNAAAAGGTHTGDYILGIGQSGSLGPKRVTGKIILGNNATLTVTGTLWVENNIELSNGCTIRLDPGYGSSSGVVLTDNNFVISNNCTFQGSGNPQSYLMGLSAKDSPLEEIMTVDNNSLGAIYYAGRGKIKFSNNARAKEATGYGIILDNGAIVTYESGLANLLFTNGPGAGWSLKRGTYQKLQ